MIYRDTNTGRFARRSTWRRSVSHGGTRYKRQRQPARTARAISRKLPVPPLTLPPGEYPVKITATRGKGKRQLEIDARVTIRQPMTRQQITLGFQRMAENRPPAGMKLRSISYGHTGVKERTSSNAARDLIAFSPAILNPENIKVEE